MDRGNVDGMRAGLVRYITERWPHACEPASESPTATQYAVEAVRRALVLAETLCGGAVLADDHREIIPAAREALRVLSGDETDAEPAAVSTETMEALPVAAALDLKTFASFGGETCGSPVRWGGPGQHAACDTAIVGLRARAEADEAKLRQIAAYVNLGPRVRAQFILGIIGTEGDSDHG